jgi:hypothetical protein
MRNQLKKHRLLVIPEVGVFRVTQQDHDTLVTATGEEYYVPPTFRLSFRPILDLINRCIDIPNVHELALSALGEYKFKEREKKRHKAYRQDESKADKVAQYREACKVKRAKLKQEEIELRERVEALRLEVGAVQRLEAQGEAVEVKPPTIP